MSGEIVVQRLQPVFDRLEFPEIGQSGDRAYDSPVGAVERRRIDRDGDELAVSV
jgi:hypothetical protein